MEGLEARGKNVDEALARALQQLGLSREEVEVQVLSEGRSGLFGLGSEQARVIVKPRAPEPPPLFDEVAPGQERHAEVPLASRQELIAGATEITEDLLRLMGLRAKVKTRKPETPGDGAGSALTVLDIEGDDLGLLIGRRGETLAALQYMVNLILQRRFQTSASVSVDVEGYRRRRESSLRNLALRMADRVRNSGQAITLEPMPPNERRIVHLTLAKDPDVSTVSMGEGDNRKVSITPKR